MAPSGGGEPAPRNVARVVDPTQELASEAAPRVYVRPGPAAPRAPAPGGVVEHPAAMPVLLGGLPLHLQQGGGGHCDRCRRAQGVHPNTRRPLPAPNAGARPLPAPKAKGVGGEVCRGGV